MSQEAHAHTRELVIQRCDKQQDVEDRIYESAHSLWIRAQSLGRMAPPDRVLRRVHGDHAVENEFEANSRHRLSSGPRIAGSNGADDFLLPSWLIANDGPRCGASTWLMRHRIPIRPTK